MTQLALAFLGSMQVAVQGQCIAAFPYEKVRALLAYLVMESDYPQSRDRLAGLLWTDQSESQSRSNLRKALSTLRQVLGDTNSASPLFLTTHHTIQFNIQGDYTLDVKDIKTLTQFNTSLHPFSNEFEQTDKLSKDRVADLEAAVALYQGPFLDQLHLPNNEAFEAWVLLYRDQFHTVVVDACALLAAYYEHQRDYLTAQRYAQQQLQLEPWNEAAHRSLMRLLMQIGKRQAALQQYARCCRILEQVFDTHPEPETIAVWQVIRSGAELSSAYA